MRKPIAILCALALAAAAGAQTPKSPQKPGKWEVTLETEMHIPGMPVKMKPVTNEVCVTEQDLANPQRSVPGDAKSPCTISNYKVNGNIVTYDVDCPKQQTKGTAEITYSSDTYKGAMKMKWADKDVTTLYTGKWLGPACTPPSKK
jgi:hypothetical protein